MKNSLDKYFNSFINTLLTFAGIFFILSCSKNSEYNNTAVHKNETKDSVHLNPEIIEVKDSFMSISENGVEIANYNFLSKIPIKKIPLADSTNFDNYKIRDGFNDDLFLKKIQFKKENSNIEDIRIRYQIKISKNFQSIVITYLDGEHEMFTTLLNINSKSEIVDQLDIAYDEIAESAIRKMSKIDRDKIIVTDWNYFSEKPIKTTTIYQITREGKFKAVSK